MKWYIKLLLVICLANFCLGCEKETTESSNQCIYENEKQYIKERKNLIIEQNYDPDRVLAYLTKRSQLWANNKEISREIIQPEMCYIVFMPQIKKCVHFCHTFYSDGLSESVLDSCEGLEEEILNPNALLQQKD